MHIQSSSEVKSEAVSLLSSEQKYGVTPYRFLILILYVISCNQTMLITGVFVPLQSTVQTIYDESLLFINFALVVTAYVAYMFAAPFVNYSINHLGLRPSIIIGSLLTAAGCWVRCLSKHGFIWIFIGQCIAFLAQPYYFATPQKFSNVWFAPNERNYSTGFMQVMQNVGTIIGPLMAGWFIDFDADNQTIIDQLNNMMFFTAIMATVSLVIMIILLREKPEIPPSKAAIAVRYDVMTSVKKLLKNGNAMLMITSTSLVNAVIWSYIGVFQQLILPFGFNGDEAGNIISIAIGIGVFGLFIGTYIVEKYKKYNWVINTSNILSCLSLVASFFAVESGSFVGFCLTLTICQFTYAPSTPAALEYGVELAFPVEEATMGGIWYFINQIGAIIGNLVGDALLGNTPTRASGRNTFIFFIVSFFLVLSLNFFVKQKLRRENYESDNNGNQKARRASKVEAAT